MTTAEMKPVVIEVGVLLSVNVIDFVRLVTSF